MISLLGDAGWLYLTQAPRQANALDALGVTSFANVENTVLARKFDFLFFFFGLFIGVNVSRLVSFCSFLWWVRRKTVQILF